MFTRTMGALSRKRLALGGTQRGFTLIELLVVVLIIGVLAAVAIPIFLGQQDGARDSAVKAQITAAKVAVVGEITNPAITPGPPVIPAGLVGLSGFTTSEEITVTYAGVPTTGTPTTFCIEGDYEGGNIHHITESGAAEENGC